MEKRHPAIRSWHSKATLQLADYKQLDALAQNWTTYSKTTIMRTTCTPQTNLIKTFVSVACIIISCGVYGQEINISQRSHIVMNGNVSLVVNNAAFKNTGNFIAGTGTVVFSGNNDTTASYVSGTTSFYNLTVSKAAYGVALKSTSAVRNTLTMAGGNLYTDSNLVLKSDAALTARVAAVPASSNIIGKTRVERYIPARRAWRMLTAPLTDANTIFNTWQNSGVYEAGVNTFVTGPAPTNINGLDASPLNNVSMKKWNSATQSFSNVTNTKVSISAGNSGSADNTGYYMFVRGDRNTNNFNTNTCNATTLSSTGRLQIGTQTFTTSAVSGAYTLIGNPYASPVDFSTVTRTNLVNRFYVWDPSLNILGGYVMLDDLSNTGNYNKSVSASSQTKEIQSGQAFLVLTKNNAAASITFNEVNKAAINNNLVFRPSNGNSQFLRVNLSIVQADSAGSMLLADGIFAEFNDNFSDAVDLDDAVKFVNVNENMAFVRNGNALAAERRPFVNQYDTLFLKLWKTTPNTYQFDITPSDFYGTDIFLQDSYLNTTTNINSFATSRFNFTIDGNTASADANRFRIIFRKLGVLPVTITSINAAAQNNNVAVEWKVENEVNIAKYVVEKCTDGSSFTTAETLTATGFNNSHNTYNWLDVTAVQGTNFYRIKIIEISGQVKYSPIVKVVLGKSSVHTMSIYPNPVRNNVINLQLANQPKGNYQFHLTNNIGQTIYTGSMTSNSGNGTLSLNIPARLTSGIYQLEVVTPANNRETQKVIVE